MLTTRTFGGVLLAVVLGTAAPWRLSVQPAQDGTSTQRNQSRKFGPGECRPVDPTYIHVANETGGQPFFLNPSEVAKAFHFIRESSGNSNETLLWATGSFEAASPQEYSVPVD